MLKVRFDNYFWQAIGLSGVIIISIVGIVFLQIPRTKNLMKLSVEDYQRQEQVEKVSLDVIKDMPTFGFKNLVSDWLFLQFIQYYGDGDARKKTGYTLSPDYLELVTRYDPYFIWPYLVMSPASSIDAGRPDRTVKIFEERLKKLSPKIPDAYFIWIYKGIDELLFLGDNEAAKNSYQMAADWAQIAGNSKIATSARDTAEFLAKNPDSKKARIGAWFTIFGNATNEQTRQFAKENIEKLGARIEINPDGSVKLIQGQED